MEGCGRELRSRIFDVTGMDIEWSDVIGLERIHYYIVPEL